MSIEKEYRESFIEKPILMLMGEDEYYEDFGREVEEHPIHSPGKRYGIRAS